MRDYHAAMPPSTAPGRFDPHRPEPVIAVSDTAVLLAPGAPVQLARLNSGARALLDHWVGAGAARVDLADGLALWHRPGAVEDNPAASAIAGGPPIRGQALLTGADRSGLPAGLNRIQAARIITALQPDTNAT